mmetsp:Transcript_20566/g.63972  ORF Transcript_20566/g.63972 Transcript_20566/m.63972 type:complete len:314 (-) Transcript_20566:978-1919(-)
MSPYSSPSVSGMSFGSPDAGNCGSPPAVSMFVPMFSIRAISFAISTWSPVTILTSTPYLFAFAIVAFVSGRGGSRNVRIPSIRHSSFSNVRATDRHRIPRIPRSVMIPSTRSWICDAFEHSFSTMFGAPFVTLNCTPSGPTSVASVRFTRGSNGLYSSCLYASHRSRFAAPSTIVSSASRGGSRHFAASAAYTSTLSRSSPAEKTGQSCWISILFSVSVPVLSEHSRFSAAIISIADSRVTITFFDDSSFDPSASVVVTTISIAIGIDTTSSTTVNSIAALNDVWWYVIRKMKQMMHRMSDSPVSPYMTLTST